MSLRLFAISEVRAPLRAVRKIDLVEAVALLRFGSGPFTIAQMREALGSPFSAEDLARLTALLNQSQ